MQVHYVIKDSAKTFYMDVFEMSDTAMNISNDYLLLEGQINLICGIRKQILKKELCYISQETVFDKHVIFNQNKELKNPFIEFQPYIHGENESILINDLLKKLNINENKIYIDKDKINEVMCESNEGKHSLSFIMIDALFNQLNDLVTDDIEDIKNHDNDSIRSNQKRKSLLEKYIEMLNKKRKDV